MPEEVVPVHVELWGVTLAPSPEFLREAAGILSESERQRAGAFHFERDRTCWIAARSSLRMLLARWLKTSAAEVELTVTESGKPRLADSSAGVHFNVSHSGGRALIVLSSRGPVGVDVEPYSRGSGLPGCKESFLCENELRALADQEDSRPVPDKLIKIWCAKEAWLKAVGVGLSLAPQTLEVKWQDDGSAVVQSLARPETEAFLRLHFPPFGGNREFCAAAALPVSMPCPRVEFFDPVAG